MSRFKSIFFSVLIWASVQENLSFGLVNKKGADKPALITNFAICLSESIISNLLQEKLLFSD